MTLNELYGRAVGENEREKLVKVFMMRPRCGYYADGKLPEEIARDAYKFM